MLTHVSETNKFKNRYDGHYPCTQAYFLILHMGERGSVTDFGTIFLRSDTAATIFSLPVFVQLLFKDSQYATAAFIPLESLWISPTAE